MVRQVEREEDVPDCRLVTTQECTEVEEEKCEADTESDLATVVDARGAEPAVRGYLPPPPPPTPRTRCSTTLKEGIFKYINYPILYTAQLVARQKLSHETDRIKVMHIVISEFFFYRNALRWTMRSV